MSKTKQNEALVRMLLDAGVDVNATDCVSPCARSSGKTLESVFARVGASPAKPLAAFF